ncbi:MAG: Cna B-type domain-containing protein [Christensenellales bacterium]
MKKENITVRIEWEDEDNAIGLRLTTLAVTLSGSDGQTYSAKIAERTAGRHTFADLTTQRGAEVIYYSGRGRRGRLRQGRSRPTYTAQPVVDEQPAADDENLIDDQMDGDPPSSGRHHPDRHRDGRRHQIDMGETAEEPVEGEEANAEKPAEDGELDEDFIS